MKAKLSDSSRNEAQSRCGRGVAWLVLKGSLRQLRLKKHYMIQSVLLNKLLQMKNLWIKSLVKMRIYSLKKKNALQEKFQKLFTRLFIRRKDIEHTSQVSRY